MKKKLLVLLATCCLQTPVFAVLTEVTVLKKGKQRVLLYGDEHTDVSERKRLLEMDCNDSAQTSVTLRYRQKVAQLEGKTAQQASEIASQIAQLEREHGKQCTVLLEGGNETPHALVREVEQLCSQCLGSAHDRAKEVLLPLIHDRYVKGIFPTLAQLLPETTRTICVDTMRNRLKLFMHCIDILAAISHLKLAGVDCTNVHNKIRDAMGTTSLADLYVHEEINGVDRNAPLYEVLTALLKDDTYKRVWTALGMLFVRSRSTLDNSALQNITSLASQPGMVVLLAGSWHTLNVETMLRAKGYRVVYKCRANRGGYLE